MTTSNFVTRTDQLEYRGTVLRDFWGELHDVRFFTENQRDKARLEFTGVEVLKSVAPYEFPVAQVDFNAGKSDQSGWGKLIISAGKCGYNDLLGLKGHRVHMVGIEQSFTDQQGREVQFVTWGIVGVDGTDIVPQSESDQNGATLPVIQESDDPEAEILRLLDGKTQGEFAQVFSDHPLWNQYRSEVFNGQLYQRLVDEGKVELDAQERYQVVGS